MTNTKLTVLAEEAVPMTEMDITALDQRIHDAEENLIAAVHSAAVGPKPRISWRICAWYAPHSSRQPEVKSPICGRFASFPRVIRRTHRPGVPSGQPVLL